MWSGFCDWQLRTWHMPRLDCGGNSLEAGRSVKRPLNTVHVGTGEAWTKVDLIDCKNVYKDLIEWIYERRHESHLMMVRIRKWWGIKKIKQCSALPLG